MGHDNVLVVNVRHGIAKAMRQLSVAVIVRMLAKRVLIVVQGLLVHPQILVLPIVVTVTPVSIAIGNVMVQRLVSVCPLLVVLVQEVHPELVAFLVIVILRKVVVNRVI